MPPTSRPPCATPGTTELPVAVTATERPFAPGVAFGVVTGNSCDALCNSLTDEHRFELSL